jgi:hypothetical protein
MKFSIHTHIPSYINGVNGNNTSTSHTKEVGPSDKGSIISYQMKATFEWSKTGNQPIAYEILMRLEAQKKDDVRPPELLIHNDEINSLPPLPYGTEECTIHAANLTHIEGDFLPHTLYKLDLSGCGSLKDLPRFPERSDFYRNVNLILNFFECRSLNTFEIPDVNSFHVTCSRGETYFSDLTSQKSAREQFLDIRPRLFANNNGTNAAPAPSENSMPAYPPAHHRPPMHGKMPAPKPIVADQMPAAKQPESSITAATVELIARNLRDLESAEGLKRNKTVFHMEDSKGLQNKPINKNEEWAAVLDGVNDNGDAVFKLRPASTLPTDVKNASILRGADLHARLSQPGTAAPQNVPAPIQAAPKPEQQNIQVAEVKRVVAQEPASNSVTGAMILALPGVKEALVSDNSKVRLNPDGEDFITFTPLDGALNEEWCAIPRSNGNRDIYDLVPKSALVGLKNNASLEEFKPELVVTGDALLALLK